MTNSTDVFGVTTHNTPTQESSWIAKTTMAKGIPVQISTADVNTVVVCGANSAKFMGITNEQKDAGYTLGVNEAEYFVGLVGTGGVTLGDYVKTDGASGFIVGTAAGSYQVATALATGVAGDYVEFRKFPAVILVPTP